MAYATITVAIRIPAHTPTVIIFFFIIFSNHNILSHGSRAVSPASYTSHAYYTIYEVTG